MARIKDARGRREDETPSGYERLFGNRRLGMLISKVQSAVISTGNELEKILASKLRDTEGISIQNINKNDRIFRKAKRGKDLLIDCVINKDEKIKLIEIKDGDTFDTKKVAGEVESLQSAKEHLIKKGIAEENISLHFCSFNARDHEQIKKGTKGLLPKDSAMTGRELCNELGLNFDEIVNERKKYQEENLNHFLNELARIPGINKKLKKFLKQKSFF